MFNSDLQVCILMLVAAVLLSDAMVLGTSRELNILAITGMFNLDSFRTITGLALTSSQIANGYLVSPLATEQRDGVAKLAAGGSGSV